MPSRSTRWNINVLALMAGMLVLPASAAMAYTEADGYRIVKAPAPNAARQLPPVVVVPYSPPPPVSEIVVERQVPLSGEERVFAEIMNAPREQSCLSPGDCKLDIQTTGGSGAQSDSTAPAVNRREQINP